MRFPAVRPRPSAALVAVGMAGMLALSACGPLGGGSDAAATGSGKTSARPAATPAVSPAAALGAPASAADAAKITTLARYVVLTDNNSKTVCADKLSAKFVATVFQTPAKCRHSIQPDDPGNRTKDATVSDIRVNGLAATATVTEVGGEWAGARGTWAFLRDGDTWRVAAWGVDYLRSAFHAQWGAGYHARGGGELIDDPAVRSCLDTKFQKHSDPVFTDLAFGLFRDDKTALGTYTRYENQCELVRGPDGLSPLRRNFEAGLKSGADRVGKGALAACVAQRLRSTIPDQDLQKWIKAGGTAANVPAWMGRRIAQAGEACSASAPRTTST